MELTFTDSQPRYYSELGVVAEPGKVYELDVDPGDGRWQGKSKKETKPAEEPESVEVTEPVAETKSAEDTETLGEPV